MKLTGAIHLHEVYARWHLLHEALLMATHGTLHWAYESVQIARPPVPSKEELL